MNEANKKLLVRYKCTFRDRNIENSFESQYFSSIKRLFIPAASGVLILFILFCVPDFVFCDSGLAAKNLLLRFSSVILFIALYYAFGRLRNWKSYILIVNFMEVGFTVLHLLNISNYSEMNFLIKSMDIIIMITFFYSFPNKWLYSVTNSLLLIFGFFIFTVNNTAKFTQDSSYAAGSVYIAIALIMNCFNSYRLNYFKRSQYYNIAMLKRLINTDKLTGAYTRTKFDEDIKKQIRSAKISGRTFSLTIMDIDDFKHINDTYGHLEGDNILSGIAQVISTHKRQKDILSRWGGEEFVIIFPSTSLASAIRITERLRKLIASAKFSISEAVTCSFGVTEFHESDTPVTMLRRADKLMYDAKAAGKNVVFSDLP